MEAESVGATASSAGTTVTCRDGDRRLDETRCGVCSCASGEWSCPEPTPTCDQVCSEGDTIPGPNNCGFCNCIASTWVCEGEDRCECDYAPTAEDDGYCGSDICDPYGRLVPDCDLSTGHFEGEDNVVGEDPFSIDALVPCEDSVQALEYPAQVVGASIDADLLTLQLLYEGGCREHRFGLCFDGDKHTRGNLPERLRRIGVFVAHRRSGDICGMSVSETLTFDVSRAAEIYAARASNTGFDPGSPVLLEIDGFDTPIAYEF